MWKSLNDLIFLSETNLHCDQNNILNYQNCSVLVQRIHEIWHQGVCYMICQVKSFSNRNDQTYVVCLDTQYKWQQSIKTIIDVTILRWSLIIVQNLQGSHFSCCLILSFLRQVCVRLFFNTLVADLMQALSYHCFRDPHT